MRACRYTIDDGAMMTCFCIWVKLVGFGPFAGLLFCFFLVGLRCFFAMGVVNYGTLKFSQCDCDLACNGKVYSKPGVIWPSDQDMNIFLISAQRRTSQFLSQHRRYPR
jgi:hypothetical protein